MSLATLDALPYALTAAGLSALYPESTHHQYATVLPYHISFHTHTLSKVLKVAGRNTVREGHNNLLTFSKHPDVKEIDAWVVGRPSDSGFCTPHLYAFRTTEGDGNFSQEVDFLL